MSGTEKGVSGVAKPKRGKGSAVLIRVTQETRQALEREAERTGRSLSQTAELWIDEAVKGRSSMEEQLGGFGVAEALRAMAFFSKKVRSEIGAPEEDFVARTALLEGWQHMIERALPFSPASPSYAAARALEPSIAEAAKRALKALGQLAVDHPARLAAEAPQRTVTDFPPPSGLLQSYGFTTPEPVVTEHGPPLIESLETAAQRPMMADHDLGSRSRAVAELGGEPAKELIALSDLLAERKSLIDLYVVERSNAIKLGDKLVATMLGIDSQTMELINKLPRLPQS